MRLTAAAAAGQEAAQETASAPEAADDYSGGHGLVFAAHTAAVFGARFQTALARLQLAPADGAYLRSALSDAALAICLRPSRIAALLVVSAVPAVATCSKAAVRAVPAVHDLAMPARGLTAVE